MDNNPRQYKSYENKGIIFDIKRYAVNDGPGLRVTVFLKGCPLKCLWCHNPESQLPVPETIERTRRVGERAFTYMETIGKSYTVQELMLQINKDWLFMEESGGGVTFSGGEPLMQPDFLEASLIACKEHGYHTAVDTSGYASPIVLKRIAEYTDLFLFDIKNVIPEYHKKGTGGELDIVLKSLDTLSNMGKKIIARFPFIPGYNSSMEQLTELKELLLGKGIKELHILPFHKIADGKYHRMNMENNMAGTNPPSDKEIELVCNFFLSAGFSVKTGG